MQLYEFTTVTGESGARVVLVSGRVANHPDPAEQKEWITFRIAVDVPTALSGTLQRAAALERVRVILHQLEVDFERIGHQRGQAMLRPGQ